MPTIKALPPNTEGPAGDDLIPIHNASKNETEKLPLSALSPVGSMSLFAGDTAPAGYLICDGEAVSRETYANLFTVIGEKYGAGDGTTTFNLPNMKGRVPVGLDPDDSDFNTLGKSGGAKTHTLTVAQMPNHRHTGHYFNGQKISLNNGSGGYQMNWTAGAASDESSFATGYSGGGSPHPILQPYLAFNYIIKS